MLIYFTILVIIEWVNITIPKLLRDFMRVSPWAFVLNWIYWFAVSIIYFKKDIRRSKNMLKHMFFAIFSFLAFEFVTFWFVSYNWLHKVNQKEFKTFISISDSILTFSTVTIDML